MNIWQRPRMAIINTDEKYFKTWVVTKRTKDKRSLCIWETHGGASGKVLSANGPKRSDSDSSDWRACLAAFTGAIEELPNDTTIEICCLNKTAIQELLSIKESHDRDWRRSGSNRPRAAIEILLRLYEALYGDATNPRSVIVKAHTPKGKDHSTLDRLRRALDGAEQ